MLTTIDVGNKISDGRKRVNLSQAQLGQLLSISSQAVGKWERGESMPDIITLNRIAEIFEVNLNYFSDRPSLLSEDKQPENKTEPAEHDIDGSRNASGGGPEKKRGWNMSNGNWVDADFSGLKNLHEKFNGSNIQKCLFIGSELSGLLLKSNNVVNCDFTRSDLNGSRIDSSNVQNCVFNEANLRRIDFSKSQIKGCAFTNADLSDATIKYSSFINNTVDGTQWNRTNCTGSQFAGMTFSGSLNDCSFENCEFSRVSFENVTMTNCFFKGTNLKRARFVNCKVDRLTLAFLKSGKADTSGIAVLDF